MTFLTRKEVEALLADFHIELFQEQDEDGDSFEAGSTGTCFHLIAQQAMGGPA